MELQKIGRFIAELRKERGLTQEQLGARIGVTNKTVSRWETGTYLPPADALLAMSELFGVSINELLSGRRLSGEAYREAAEANLRQMVKASSFSLKEKMEYYRRKWLREHIADMCLWGAGIAGALAAGVILAKPLWISGAVLLLVVGHAWRNNRMMAYVEQKVFDGGGEQASGQ